MRSTSVPKSYLARGEASAAHLREQESSIVSQFGNAIVAEAQAFHQALHQGRQVRQHLQEEERVVSNMRHEAQQAFAQEHVVCAALRLEHSNVVAEMQQMETRLNDVQWQRAEYRVWHDEARIAHRHVEVDANRLRDRLTQTRG